MIRKFITPTQSKYNIALDIPEEYLGQELEIIVFKKQEGLTNEKKLNLTRLSEKYKGVFTEKDAQSFNEHTQQIRKEWDNI